MGESKKYRQNRQRQNPNKNWERRAGPTPRPPIKGWRPPKYPGVWQQTVSSWEKKFCTIVCFISWDKLCETKKVMYMYQTVVQWDDSAGEEAFKNAKTRFWAKMNGFDCNIPLLDPDQYIDVVDQDTVIDSEMMEDLDKLSTVSDNEESSIINLNSFRLGVESVAVTGWGDEDDVDPIMDESNNCNENGVCKKEILPNDPWARGEDTAWGHIRDNSGEIWETVNRRSDKRYNKKSGECGHFGSRYMNTRLCT